MTAGSNTRSYQRSPHRLVIERACAREDCRNAMAADVTRELFRRGGRPSERALGAAREHAQEGCDRFVARAA
jgi:hypothetical protein